MNVLPWVVGGTILDFSQYLNDANSRICINITPITHLTTEDLFITNLILIARLHYISSSTP